MTMVPAENPVVIKNIKRQQQQQQQAGSLLCCSCCNNRLALWLHWEWTRKSKNWWKSDKGQEQDTTHTQTTKWKSSSSCSSRYRYRNMNRVGTCEYVWAMCQVTVGPLLENSDWCCELLIASSCFLSIAACGDVKSRNNNNNSSTSRYWCCSLTLHTSTV